MFSKLSLLVKYVSGSSSLLPSIVVAIREGKFGAVPAKVYKLLEGKKTLLSIGLYVIWGALGYVEVYVPQAVGYSDYVLQVANFLLVVGLFDGAIRFVPPVPRAPLGKTSTAGW
jgi:hypothetical protein